MKNRRNRNGFTLVEIIISVAALSFICALVLKLFLLSGDVGNRNIIKQHAVFEAANIIDTIKSMDKAEDIYSHEYFSGALIEETGSGTKVIKEADLSGRTCNIEVMLVKDDSLSSPDGEFMDLTVRITDEDKTIFILNGGKYFAKN